MLERYAAHLRFHWRISPRNWEKMKLKESEIIEWYYEFIYIKEELGEIKRENPNQ